MAVSITLATRNRLVLWRKLLHLSFHHAWFSSHENAYIRLWSTDTPTHPGFPNWLFEAKFQKAVLFNVVDDTKLIWIFALLLAFLHAKIIWTKMTYHPFSSFFLQEQWFLVSYIWQYFCRQGSGQKGASRKPVSRLNTVDTCYVYKTSPERRFPGTVALVCFGPRKCLDVINNNTNLPCQVYLLYEITCCGEIVTPSAVFVNNFLLAPIAMSNKWKDSYDSNHTYTRKLEETFVWAQRAADGSEAAYCKLYHCNILLRISNLSNHEKSEKHKRGELHYKARHDLM
jgi:hypothetical protein